MIIVGSKGFAMQLIEVFYQNRNIEELFLFDNISADLPNKLFEFPILTTEKEVIDIIKNKDRKFCLGLSNPLYRRRVVEMFESFGAELCSIISDKAHVATHVKSIGLGATVLTSSIIENNVIIGKGVLINSCAAVFHDCKIGDYVEIAPGAKILGAAEIGDNSIIGANATILPKIKLGKNVIVGAGAVVNRNVPDNTTVVGVPAKPIIK